MEHRAATKDGGSLLLGQFTTRAMVLNLPNTVLHVVVTPKHKIIFVVSS